MTKKKTIKIKMGCKKKLAEACNVGTMTVYRALRWDADTDVQNLVRRRARELGYIKKF